MEYLKSKNVIGSWWKVQGETKVLDEYFCIQFWNELILY